jgi:thiamine-monophosphate kinase
MKVSELGEFGLIDLLAQRISDSKINRYKSDQLIIGIGDDAAAWRGDVSIQLATVDTMIEDVHFSLETITWRELGWKSLAINLSDIAAMGGVPRYALIALGLPEDTEVEAVTRLYEGMIELASLSNVAIVGGNVSRSPLISITATILGNSTNDKILRRATARPDDTIAVTGHPGSAAAGQEMLKEKLEFRSAADRYLREAFVHPRPRLTEGQLLVKYGVSTGIDISDGLLADLRHICEASQVSARIDTGRLPVHPAVREHFGDRAEELALSGGEDYELLFTARAEVIERVGAETACPVTDIGKITAGRPGKIDLFDAKGNPVKAGRTGWVHFQEPED